MSGVCFVGKITTAESNRDLGLLIIVIDYAGVLTETQGYAHLNTHARTHAHARTHTHTLTHTHTHTLSLSLPG